VVTISTEHDPTPAVLFAARVLRQRLVAGGGSVSGLEGATALQSASDPQAVTVRVADGAVELSHGVAPDAERVVEVDIDGPFSPTAPEALDDTGRALVEILSAPLPTWQDSLGVFWELSKDVRGMPASLEVLCSDGTEAVVGSGEPRYRIAGSPEALERVFYGVDIFLYAVVGGAITVEGSGSQLSVLTGASWRARFDGGS